MQRITPCLWFGGDAEEAVAFYTAIFPDSKVRDTLYYDKASSQAAGMPEGSVLTMTFELDGQSFMVLNGQPNYPFTQALSLSVSCDSQDEVDHYWSRLGDGGEEIACGWLKDRYGLFWQIVPRRLPELLSHKDPTIAAAAMEAMMQMKKIDIAELERAAGL